MVGLILLYTAGGLVGLLFAAFLVLTLYIYYVHWKYSHIPSPKMPSFIYLGHFPDILRARKESGNDELPLSDLILRWYQEVGCPVFVVYFFWRVFVVTLDPEDIQDIVRHQKNNKPKDIMHFFGNLFGERFLGDSLLTIRDHETWKTRRKIYDPAFNKRHLIQIT